MLLAALLALCITQASGAAVEPIKVSEGTVSIPSYEHTGRQTQPALFSDSTAGGLYPFVTYQGPFKGTPQPRTYPAVFIENEYLKLTYLTELGGRIWSVYDKVRGREMFYRNDVVKPAPYNPKTSWPQSGVELTGPYDAHMLTLYGEPNWSHKVVRNADGSVSLVLGEIDPVYHMKVNWIATLHPGIAAMQLSVFCYNMREARMPQMFWISAAVPGTPKTEFIYPMTRTIGHTTSEIAEWPVFNGTDYSWDRNNKNMLGVFGIDIYDNFQGAYHHDLDYGVFRYADRRVVTGMKMWTFGYGPNSKGYERGYTDNAGPYVEVQSGRHVWDGHYEWVGPQKTENWSEWWVPVSGLDGLTTITRDVALKLEVKADPAGANSSVKIGLSPIRVIPGAKVLVRAASGEILNATADLVPGKTAFVKTAGGIKANADGLKQMTVTVTDASGKTLLAYTRPDDNPGRKEYTPFTRPLENPQKTPEQMSAEELVLAADFKIKELNTQKATELINKALEKDPGYSRAHLLLGESDFVEYRYKDAVAHLQKAIDRDAYLDEAYYYLAVSQFAAGDEKGGERNLYYIPPFSGYYGPREYQLGRIAYMRGEIAQALEHLDKAVGANRNDLNARLLTAIIARDKGNEEAALKELAEIEKADPVNPWVAAERYLGKQDETGKELLNLTGAQTQDALDVSGPYRKLGRWKDAVAVLKLIEAKKHDIWGTTPEFYYVTAYCLDKAGNGTQAGEYRSKARAAAGNVDRYPYREDSEAPLAAAVEKDAKDVVARFNLACLLYSMKRPADAIRQWEAGVETAPNDFASRRALGLAYAEQGEPIEKAAAQLEKAVEINPAHLATRNDLSSMYARAGRIDEQLAVAKKALERSPNDDNLTEAVLTGNLIKGSYGEAETLVATHKFAQRHRSYGLRDKYRFMRYGMGGLAFNKGDYAEALKLYESALKPPVSLGVDDFQFESTPRVNYYIGRALEAMGKEAEAKQAYEKSAKGVDQLSGDRDSWNSENFHMILALEKLGKKDQAAQLQKHFEEFAKTQMDAKYAHRRSEGRYLLGLVKKHDGDTAEAKRLMEEAVKIEPDFLAPRIELRGDVIDPLK
jgi:tetratricopeptide (TPR) repeat protein